MNPLCAMPLSRYSATLVDVNQVRGSFTQIGLTLGGRFVGWVPSAGLSPSPGFSSFDTNGHWSVVYRSPMVPLSRYLRRAARTPVAAVTCTTDTRLVAQVDDNSTPYGVGTLLAGSAIVLSPYPIPPPGTLTPILPYWSGIELGASIYAPTADLARCTNGMYTPPPASLAVSAIATDGRNLPCAANAVPNLNAFATRSYDIVSKIDRGAQPPFTADLLVDPTGKVTETGMVGGGFAMSIVIRQAAQAAAQALSFGCRTTDGGNAHVRVDFDQMVTP